MQSTVTRTDTFNQKYFIKLQQKEFTLSTSDNFY